MDQGLQAFSVLVEHDNASLFAHNRPLVVELRIESAEAARTRRPICRKQVQISCPQVDSTLRAKSRRFLLVPAGKQMESIRQADETGALCQSCKVLCIPPSKRARRSVAEGSAGAIEHVCAATRGAAGRTQAPIAARTAPVDTCTDWTVRRSAPRCMAIRVWPSCPLPFSDGVALARGRR
jgi:hypothetical protein